MNPKYIFAAVIAVSILMIGLLPQLGHSANVPVVQAEQQAAPLPVVTVTHPVPDKPAPTVSAASIDAPASIETAASTDAPAAIEAPASTEEAVSAQVENNQPAEPVSPPAQAGDVSSAAPREIPGSQDGDLSNFVASVRNNQPDTITGVYAPGLFGMHVTNQPGGDENYVSSEENVLTQYSKPAEFGVVAMLAHNYLDSGKLLSQLHPDQEIYLVYGDGKVTRYQVAKVQYFQALSPHDNRSDFRDLNGPGGAVVSYDQLFNQVYTRANQLVFQTCLEANGDLSWGRIFISANPSG